MKLNRGEWFALIALGVILLFSIRPADTLIRPEQLWRDQLDRVRSGQTSSIELPDINLPPDLLADLDIVKDKLTELNIAGEQLSDQIDKIVDCEQLKVLHLRTRLGDVELSRIATLRNLEVLDLPLAMELTDSGLALLSDHSKLKLLRLRAPKVTDAGLKPLSRMPGLKWVHLMEVPVTDAGLTVFREMPHLESLYLDGDRATDQGLSQLVLERPDLHFHRDQVHLEVDPRGTDGHRD